MNSQSVTDILLSLKTLVGEEAFQQSLSAISAKPEKSSAFGVPKEWSKTVQQTADRLNALPEALAEAMPKKKGGRPKMTEEQKAEAKIKRDAKKSAKAEAKAEAEETFEDVPAFTPEKFDLSFYSWEHDGKTYLRNDRGDLLFRDEDGCADWVGRWNGLDIDQSIPEPEDFNGVVMRD